MKKMTKIIGMSVLGLSVAVTIPVLAYEAGTTMHGPGHNMMRSGMMPMRMMHSEANVEQHLGQLKESLQLTEDQQPAWEQFEQAVTTMAANKPAGPWGHAQGNDSGDMETHFAQMEQRMAQMKTVFEARKALVETLTDKQKEAMESFMPGPFGHHG